MKVIAIILYTVLLFGYQCAYSEATNLAPAAAVDTIPDQDSDYDGIPDSKDSYPFIASYAVFKWEVTSASLDYDVQQTTRRNSGSSSENSTTKSIKGTFSWAIGADGKIEAGIHGSAGLNANPFKGFGLFSSAITAEGGVSASAYGQARKAKNVDDNEVNAQREFFEINDSEAIGNLHFTFSVNFRNFSKSPLIIKMASLPIVIGDRHIADAKPENINADGLLELPPNRREGVLVMFRAAMNNTKALELVNWLKNGSSPTIDLARSALSVHAKNDASEIDFISRVNDIESNDSLLTVRTPGGSVAWRIARKLGRKSVTLYQAMIEINKMLRNEGGASSDLFELSDDRRLVNIAQMQKVDGIWGGLDDNAFTVANSNMLNASIPEQLTLTLLDRDGIRADLDRIIAGIKNDNLDKILVSFMCRKPMWQFAADKNWPEGQCLLGLCFTEGKIESENTSEGMRWFEKAARQGCAPAQLFLGLGYYKGEGVMKDLTNAVIWFRKAADQGMRQAQNMLGIFYENGEGVPKDLNEAFNWYRKSADLGCAGAQANLGGYYYFGRVVTQDKAEAAKWFRKSADQGMEQAQYLIGKCYYGGEGVPEDKGEAVKWLRKSADNRMAQAQYLLGLCYYKGEGVTENKAEAIKWFRKAADQGLADAQNNLGVCYNDGDGVAIDRVESIKWFRMAAEHGAAPAQYILGKYYNEGDGVVQDKEESVKWLSRASEQGFAKAQYSLGVSYYKGEGVTKNQTEALRLFRLSASQGYDAAIKVLKQLGY